MMSDLLVYDQSILNPVLKIIIFIVFLATATVYLDARRQFGGRVLRVINLLFCFAVFMAVGALIRYFGDGLSFGFTPDLSMKWFQSLAYIVAVSCLILAGHQILILFRRKDT
ncbi:hypothetical protein [uncultured Methanospirillum sp.]|uniref:hypothetical protein n=1 Tax=uncultured Methanospirillum sp. TaxID=262503 RepID=UPI0029C746DB|nr:hypothetical protein [uncultured Methanospirillum sp.]